jgi:hypothetical protein
MRQSRILCHIFCDVVLKPSVYRSVLYFDDQTCRSKQKGVLYFMNSSLMVGSHHSREMCSCLVISEMGHRTFSFKLEKWGMTNARPPSMMMRTTTDRKAIIVTIRLYSRRVFVQSLTLAWPLLSLSSFSFCLDPSKWKRQTRVVWKQSCGFESITSAKIANYPFKRVWVTHKSVFGIIILCENSDRKE